MKNLALSKLAIMRVMLLVLLLGLLCFGIGLYFLWFTSITEQYGIKGMMFVVILITIGLTLLIPAKVYIILQLMNRESRKKVK